MKNLTLIAMGLLVLSSFSCGLIPSYSEAEKQPTLETVKLIGTLPAVTLKTDEILFMPQNYQGSSKKHDLSIKTNQLIYVQDLRSNPAKGGQLFQYPATYGVAPRRFKDERKLLNVLVFGSSKLYKDMVESRNLIPRPVRVIGAIQLEECDKSPCEYEKDEKVIAVDAQDKVYQGVQSIDMLPEKDRLALENFYSQYKGTIQSEGETLPRVNVTNFADYDDAFSFINDDYPVLTPEKWQEAKEACITIYETIYDTYGKKKEKVKKEKDYLRCIERFDHVGFNPEHAQFKFFNDFTALQYLLKLDIKKTKLPDAPGKLKAQEGVTPVYYKYVAHVVDAKQQKIWVNEWFKVDQRYK